MKTLVTIIAASVVATSAFAQGLLNWSTTSATGSQIKYGPETEWWGSLAGTVYSGAMVTNSGSLHAGLFVGSPGSAESALQLLSDSVITIGTAGPTRGNVPSSMAAYAVPGFNAGATVTVQMRLWNGTTTWGGADMTVAGRSAVSQIVLGGPAPAPPAAMWIVGGIAPAVDAISTPAPTGVGSVAGVQLHPVPEPTTAAIAGLGLAAMLVLRRKKA